MKCTIQFLKFCTNTVSGMCECALFTDNSAACAMVCNAQALCWWWTQGTIRTKNFNCNAEYSTREHITWKAAGGGRWWMMHKRMIRMRACCNDVHDPPPESFWLYILPHARSWRAFLASAQWCCAWRHCEFRLQTCDTSACPGNATGKQWLRSNADFWGSSPARTNVRHPCWKKFWE